MLFCCLDMWTVESVPVQKSHYSKVLNTCRVCDAGVHNVLHYTCLPIHRLYYISSEWLDGCCNRCRMCESLFSTSVTISKACFCVTNKVRFSRLKIVVVKKENLWKIIGRVSNVMLSPQVPNISLELIHFRWGPVSGAISEICFIVLR